MSKPPYNPRTRIAVRAWGVFCTRRAHFKSHFGIVLMGWSLVCACWQSVRNICFGRCCGHMIPSIHKVPACPFTAQYTVSHCTDDHTMITFPAFAAQCITHKHKCSSIGGLFLHKGRTCAISPTILHYLGRFSLIMCLSQRESYALISYLQCRG